MSDTPLGERIKALIAANGPMSVAQYMALCLGDPEHGYYTTRDPFGARGDFVTAPEVSQMFGEIVGAWLVHLWRTCGAPAPARLIELGPGRGTLMSDILRVAGRAPDFAAAMSVHLVETSPVLRVRQAEALARFDREIAWHGAFSEVPAGPLFLVANEFFDALPVRQFVRDGSVWRERVVGLDESGRLAFGIGPSTLSDGDVALTSLSRGGRNRQAERSRFREGRHAQPPASPSRTSPAASRPTTFDLPSRGRLGGVTPATLPPSAADGSVLEISPASLAIVAEIARRIVVEGGAALIVDYGYAGGAGETLQAVSAHSYADPLAAPGETDLTAHVDFAALAAAARAEGAAVHGPMPQGAFLEALGLSARAERLAANADEATRARLRSAVERLAGPAAMGTLFRALAITRADLAVPPFAV